MENLDLDNYVKLVDKDDHPFGKTYTACSITTGEKVMVLEYKTDYHRYGQRALNVNWFLPVNDGILRVIGHAYSNGGHTLSLIYGLQDQKLERLDKVIQVFYVNAYSHQPIYPGCFTANELCVGMHSLCRAVSKCHQSGVLIRNLSPASVLINIEGRGRSKLRIFDFSMAKKLVPNGNFSPPTDFMTVQGPYKPPEVLMNARVYSEAADVWALGAIFALAASLKELFPWTNNATEQLDGVFRVLGSPSQEEIAELPPLPDWAPADMFEKMHYPRAEMTALVPMLNADGCDLIAGMLKFVPGQRISIEDALAHSYFDEVEMVE